MTFMRAFRRTPARVLGLRAIAAVTLSGCGPGERVAAGPIGGSLIVAAFGDADALLPPLIGNITGKQFVDLTFASIATPRDTLNVYGDSGYNPGLADRWEWSADSLSIAFHLRPEARWHDGQSVRPSDVRFTLGAYRSPAVASISAPYLANIDSVSVRDSSTFVVWFRDRSAAQFHDFVYNLIPIPEHVYGAVAFDSLRTSPVARTVVGSGKFRLARWEPNVQLEVVADTAHWAGRPRLDRIVWRTMADAMSAASALKTGEVDFVELLRGPALELVQGDSGVRLVRRPALDFAMATFNLRDRRDARRPHPIFADVAMRRALSQAIDRAALVKNILDTLGVTLASPYLDFQNVAGVTLLPYDPAAATRLLDSLGWRDTDGDSIRERGGQRLEFDVVAPPTSQPRVRASIIIQEAFRRIGVSARPTTMEPAAMFPALAGGQFDLAMTGFSGDPSPSFVRQPFRTGSAQNFGKYSNPGFDALADSAVAGRSPADALRAYSRAGQMLADDPPGIWLYQSIALSGMHRRIQAAPFRIDAWWAHLDQWSVTPGQELPRDQIGISAAPK
jgi:peptide/nickel transport system substrate-binding protein